MQLDSLHIGQGAHEKDEHIDFLETQLDLVYKLGLALYAQQHLKFGPSNV